MGLTVTTNISSLSAQRSMDRTQRAMDKSFAQLSSGSRITKAADDSAGLSISESLKSTIRGYSQAQRNANDGISMVQVAEGGLGEISNILVRLRELGVQSASDTVGDVERGFIDVEVQQLKNEVQRISETTRFSGTNLLDGTSDDLEIQVGINNDDFQDRILFEVTDQVATLDRLGLDGLDFSHKEGAREAMEIVNEAQTKVNGYRANMGAIQNRLISTVDNLGVSVENFSAANSRIRDTDIASSSSENVRNQVLLNASVGVLSQANQMPNIALKLIG